MDKFKLGWTTDIHLNFCSPKKMGEWVIRINELNLDGLVITGDIAEGDSIESIMDFLRDTINTKVYFVLGNHDYYNKTLIDVRNVMVNKFGPSSSAMWLGSAPFVELTEEVALVGHDGWYDGGYANWFKSKVIMADYHVIYDLKPLPSDLLYARINEISRESASYVKDGLRQAIDKGFKHLFVATHVPPWMENAVYRGVISDSNWMPHFSSKHMGDAIVEVAEENPDCHFTVLCGHSHGEATHNPTENIISYTGKARYRSPAINKVFTFATIRSELAVGDRMKSVDFEVEDE